MYDSWSLTTNQTEIMFQPIVVPALPFILVAMRLPHHVLLFVVFVVCHAVVATGLVKSYMYVSLPYLYRCILATPLNGNTMLFDERP